MEIKSFECGPLATNCYLIIDGENSVLIDAPPQSLKVIKKIIEDSNVKLSAVLLTHTHWDHAADADYYKKELGAEVYCAKEDEYRLIDPNLHTVWKLPFEIPVTNADKYLNDGELLKFGGIELKSIFTPGHTEGGFSFVLDSEKSVFTGDTLFCESVGRTDLPGGNQNALVVSIKNKLYSLPDDYKAYPGHGDSSEIGYEKSNNQAVTA
jgi:glyoxylase-like metal-dependent hydrolase (beta-lactamase superfamily II)